MALLKHIIIDKSIKLLKKNIKLGNFGVFNIICIHNLCIFQQNCLHFVNKIFSKILQIVLRICKAFLLYMPHFTVKCFSLTAQDDVCKIAKILRFTPKICIANQTKRRLSPVVFQAYLNKFCTLKICTIFEALLILHKKVHNLLKNLKKGLT